jgi:hypothetical protein
MTKEKMIEKKNELTKQSDELRANLNAVSGAIMVIDQLIAEEDGEKKIK